MIKKEINPMISVVDKIAFRYRNVLPAPVSQGDSVLADKSTIAALSRNIESLGFVFTPEILNVLFKASDEEVSAWGKEIISAMREAKGANYSYQPMYPNFPAQVIEADEVELYFNALAHYLGDWIGYRILPEYEIDERAPLFEFSNLTRVGLAYENVYADILRGLVGSKISLSATDIESVRILSAVFSDSQLVSSLPTSIPNKENLATLAFSVRDRPVVFKEVLDKAVTATDLLRIAAVFGESHPSLVTPVKFGRFSRSERKAFLSALNGFPVDSLNEDMARNVNLWKRLGEKLHPGEYSAKFPVAAKAFKDIRENVTVTTFNSELEYLLRSSSPEEAITLLSTRPGEFVRRLNQLLVSVSSDEQQFIIDFFQQVASKASTPVLLQALNYFKARGKTKNGSVRLFFPKGVNGFAYALPDERKAIDPVIVNQLVEILTDSLKKGYSEKSALGKVFVSTDEGAHAVPFGLRSASKAFKSLGRGSRIPFSLDKTLRFFIHWKDQLDSRVDLDLSAILLDSNFKKIGEVAYYNLKELGAVHSGDITSAPHGASEFIDIDVRKYVASNARAKYVVMTVHSYTGQKLSEVHETLAGFMIRREPQSGEIYEPATVENVFEVGSASRISVPLVFDIKNGEAYWADMAVTNTMLAGGNVLNSINQISGLVQALVTKPILTLEDLFTLHGEARGTIVDNAEDADTILGYVDGELTVPLDEILAEWL